MTKNSSKETKDKYLIMKTWLKHMHDEKVKGAQIFL